MVTAALVVALALVGTALFGGKWLRADSPSNADEILQEFMSAFAYKPSNDPDYTPQNDLNLPEFYTHATGNYFDRRMKLVLEAVIGVPPAEAVYEVRTRTFTLPLGVTVLMNYVYKDNYRGTELSYPFPPAVDGGAGLFSGENAFTKNILPVYSDISEPTPPESEKLEEVGVMVWYQSEPRYNWDDTAHEHPIYDNTGFIGGWNEPRFDISANGVAVGCSCYNAISDEVHTLMTTVLPSPYKDHVTNGTAAFIMPVPMTKTQIENALNARPLQPLPFSSDQIRDILAMNPIMGYGASRDAGHAVSQWAVYNKATAPYYEIRYGDAANNADGRIQNGSTGISSNVNYLLDGIINGSPKYTLKLIPFDPEDKLFCTGTCDGPNYDEINGNEEIHLNSCDEPEQTNNDMYIQFGCPSRANEFALGKFLTVKQTLDTQGGVTSEINKYGVTEQGQFTAAINDIVANVANFSADDILDHVKKIDKIDKIDADTGISDNSDAVKIDSSTKTKLANDTLDDDTARYAALMDLYRLTRDDATNPELLKKYEKARFVANGKARYDADKTLCSLDSRYGFDYAASSPASIRNRFRYFLTFQEVGVNFSGVNQTAPTAETATAGIIENSLPFNIKQFADAGLFDEKGEPRRIVLDGGTPKWLIAAAVGYQLFNSPAAKIRRDSNIAQTAGVGAIYSIDYPGTYALDHRHLSDTTPMPTTDGVTPTDRTPRNLDLLAFSTPENAAEPTGYSVNRASPFAREDTGYEGRDARTGGAWSGGAWTGTGTCVIGRYLTPKDVTPNIPLTNDCFAIPGWTCIKEAWVLAERYENTLRTHNELALMIDVIAENGAKPLARIIEAIYADNRVGYDAAAARSRPVANSDKIIGGATAGNTDGVSVNPPAGSVEINPQAVKNAAIERVVLNLFGAQAYNDNTPHKFLGATITAQINNAAAENAKIQDGGTGADNLYQGYIFTKADDYYRVLVATALINIGKQTVVGKKFLQFVYRKNKPLPDGSDAGGAVVDNHWLDPE
ncbi:MAG: hypothetical protein LBP75_03595 [Planctomycetota bacterium]|nr:hypothetical protein [Planctomycetota bacterium]